MRFKCVLLILVFIPVLFTPVVASSETAVIHLRNISMDEILSIDSSEELDALLYPTVRELPTKYLDLYMFADPGLSSVSVDPVTFSLLAEFYPSDDGTYTWAECYAMQLYVGWVWTLYGGKRENVEDSDILALKDMTEVAAIYLTDSMSTTNLFDISALKSVLERFKAELQVDYLNKQSEIYSSLRSTDQLTGIVWSMGPDYFWKCVSYTEPVGLDRQDIVNWYNTRLKYMAALGIISKTSSRLIYSAEFGIGEVGQTDMSGVRDTNEYISDYDLPISSSGAVGSVLGISDFILAIAIIITIASCIVFGVLDFMQKRRDPFRKWRWPR